MSGFSTVRRLARRAVLALFSLSLSYAGDASSEGFTFEVEEATIAEIHRAILT